MTGSGRRILVYAWAVSPAIAAQPAGGQHGGRQQWQRQQVERQPAELLNSEAGEQRRTSLRSEHGKFVDGLAAVTIRLLQGFHEQRRAGDKQQVPAYAEQNE